MRMFGPGWRVVLAAIAGWLITGVVFIGLWRIMVERALVTPGNVLYLMLQATPGAIVGALAAATSAIVKALRSQPRVTWDEDTPGTPSG